ncbi:cytochrome c biogenesis protein ResB [Kineococcus terrestris]|uniref:cytochrome c biogenesis protein ResB n=1 Tax=Kineococcus terrestris TaxID=2044856 RepID=UPI0034DAD539
MAHDTTRDGSHLDDLRDGYRDGGPGGAASRPAGSSRSGSAGSSTAAAPLRPGEFLRYCWRQLTSMRVALFLLMLLAVAAVPGSTFPQRGTDPAGVAQFVLDHPTAGPWLDRLQFFDVYSSVWFSAVYLLLFVSLVGCVLPRAGVHWRALRSRPPRTPARLSRLPEHREAELAADPATALGAARAALGRRFRVDVRPDGGDGASGGSVAAERGHHRESGNLLFHLSLVGLLLAVATSALFSYSGQRLVTEGESFVGTTSDWDSFESGVWADQGDIPPFALTLERMTVGFEAQQTSQIGQPRQFAADVLLTDEPGAEPRAETVRVNHPAVVDGAQVSLSGNGYALRLTYRDGAGDVVADGAVPFLPQTANYDSTGVLKVPDAVDADGEPVQVGLQGVFLPAATVGSDGAPVSGFPDLANPVLVMTAWTGDLGLDDGRPQNVYELDDSGLTRVLDDAGQPVALQMQPGDVAELPGGLGTLTFEGVQRFASFDVRYTPGQHAALAFSLLATAGLVMSLFLPRRRLWVRVVPAAGGGSRVEVAGLSRGSDAGLGDEVDGVLRRLRRELGEPVPDEAGPDEPEDGDVTPSGDAPAVGDDGDGAPRRAGRGAADAARVPGGTGTDGRPEETA